MFSPMFDAVLAAILGVLAIVFFMGKGEGILNAFSGKYATEKKRTPEQERKYERAAGFFLLALCIGEIFMAIFETSWMGIISIIIAATGLILMMIYTRKILGD